MSEGEDAKDVLGRSVPRIILVAAAVVAGYLLFTTVATALKSHGLAQNEASVRKQIADLDRQHDELVSIREYLSSDEYIESVARRVLGLVKPGETRVLVTSPEADAGTPAAAPTPTDGAWWESLFGQ
ncbi:MAG: septum formation initiator family protein [Dehalococcoidia bacterium]